MLGQIFQPELAGPGDPGWHRVEAARPHPGQSQGNFGAGFTEPENGDGEAGGRGGMSAGPGVSAGLGVSASPGVSAGRA